MLDLPGLAAVRGPGRHLLGGGSGAVAEAGQAAPHVGVE